MWRNLKQELPELDLSKYLENINSYSKETIYKSAPIIVYAAQNDPWCRNVFYIGYWIEEIVSIAGNAKYTSIKHYFSEINPWDKDMTEDSKIDFDSISYWNYYNGDMPNFI